ncbi:hypothetical protein DL546_002679 [Coniochaeta pulveracea]|uniref:GH16 domain-containing protein n=1 Tax=Coniochaeta pulveracea TaxID=177199 RepID=A0A420Y4N8_9PEZI|nr:hypothetical protein DL546_002679 [Coniochaeta pulveracea]
MSPFALPPLSFLVLVSLVNIRYTTAAPSLTDDSHCGCYLTNGTDTRYFTQHKFFDFRDLEKYAGVPDILTDIDNTTNAPPTSDYFTSPDWTNTWAIQNWNTSGHGARSDASVLRYNSPNNVYIEKNADPDNPSPKTWMTLRTGRLPDFQTAAEIESMSKDHLYQYLSIRLLARTIGAPGAVTAFFTYLEQPTVQEADLEILTAGPRDVVQYTNQPSVDDDGDVIAQATQNATLPDGLEWTEWAIHRLDWTPTQSTWYVNGRQTAQIAFQVPRDPAQVVLNAWSDGGQWTGKMSVHDAAYFQIQWLEMVFNSTTVEKRDGEGQAGCKAVCSIDETPQTGKPVMLFDNAAQKGVSRASGLMVWVTTGTVLGMAYMSWA